MRRSVSAAVILLTAGAVFLGTGAYQYLSGYFEGQRVTQDWIRSQPVNPPLVEVPTPEPAPTAGAPEQPAAAAAAPAPAPQQAAPRPAPLGGIFALQVPKLGYLAAVRQGVTASVLAGGPGHIPDTPMPGEQGNLGISAHNIYWLRFGDLGAGDQIVIKAGGKDYTYRVSSSRVVSPDDAGALAYVPGYHVTLTTCWPLWAGALAKQRLVIRGDLVGGPAMGGVA